jgi:hypothetical protein
LELAVPASSLFVLVSVADSGGEPVEFPDPVAGDLLAVLRAMADPRCRRGVRHQLVSLLAIAVLAGARSYVAMAEWAHDLPVVVRYRLCIWRVPPSETTIRRVLQAVDPHMLDRAVSGWLSAAIGSERRWRANAVDGKTARGAKTPDGPAVHLLAALDHEHGVVLGQRVVDGKSNEITAFTPLLDRIDITGVVLTADAMHTQREHVAYLHRRGAHYLFIVKANQPTLPKQMKPCRAKTFLSRTTPAARATADVNPGP